MTLQFEFQLEVYLLSLRLISQPVKFIYRINIMGKYSSLNLIPRLKNKGFCAHDKTYEADIYLNLEKA